MPRAFIGIGSNIEPDKNIRAALGTLASRADVTAVSTVYVTEPVGRPGQPRFYNCTAEVSTGLWPRELKYGLLRQIEAELGRRRTLDKYAPRTIDLDLILYEGVVLDLPDIVLPDPQIKQRPFLAIPLAELAPGLEYPGAGVNLAAVAAGMTSGGMTPLPGYTAELRDSIPAPVQSARI